MQKNSSPGPCLSTPRASWSFASNLIPRIFHISAGCETFVVGLLKILLPRPAQLLRERFNLHPENSRTLRVRHWHRENRFQRINTAKTSAKSILSVKWSIWSIVNNGYQESRPMQRNPRSHCIQDPSPSIRDPEYWIQVDSRFYIQDRLTRSSLMGPRSHWNMLILDSIEWIPNSRTSNFAGFQIPLHRAK